MLKDEISHCVRNDRVGVLGAHLSSLYFEMAASTLAMRVLKKWLKTLDNAEKSCY